MNWKKNKKYVLSLLLCAPVIFAGCGSDDGDDNPPPPVPNLTGLNETETAVARRAIGSTADGITWKYSKVRQSGEGSTPNVDLTGWTGFQVNLKLATDPVGDKAAISFTATVPDTVVPENDFAVVWPASGTFSIGDVTGNNIGIGRVGEARFENGRIETNSDGTISIVFTVKAAPSGAPGGRVEGAPVATWTFELQK